MRRWINLDTKRYYQADYMKDLLGGWSVVSAWGGLGTRLGGMRSEWVETWEEAEQRLETIARQRARKGYRDPKMPQNDQENNL